MIRQICIVCLPDNIIINYNGIGMAIDKSWLLGLIYPNLFICLKTVVNIFFGWFDCWINVYDKYIFWVDGNLLISVILSLFN